MMRTGAVLSDCGTYRYHLHRVWSGGPPLVFVMFNPSTADADVDDATIRRCIGFGQSLGFGGIEVVNLFAFRATKPDDLRAAGYPVGPENDDWIATSAEHAHEQGGGVVCAWGADAAKLARPAEVLKIVRRHGVEPQCLALSKDGHPRHPLYLPSASSIRALS